MPYKSAKQRRFMHAVVPDVARKWDKKYGAKVGGGKTHKQKKKAKGGKKKHGK